MGAEERRRDPRIRVAFEVLRSMPPLEGFAFIHDVSARGARLVGTPARPEPGRAVQLTVRLPDRPVPLELMASVVRHEPDGFAIEFQKRSPELAALVAEEPLTVPAAQQAGAGQKAAKRPGVTPFREVAVDCRAGRQWISGRLCLPLRRTLVDHLNQGEPFQRTVDVVTPHQPDPLPFVALRSDALDLIVPADGQEGIDSEQRVGSFEKREVRVLLPYAVVDGTLEVLTKIRVSDHLMRCPGFVSLHDCQLRFARGQAPPRALDRVPLLLLNAGRVLGVSDLAASPQPSPEDPGTAERG